jgi:putative ABC transport system permease protein
MMNHVQAIVLDARFALRGMRSSLIITLAAIGCIGLGIGATATVFSTASAFTFRPLPQLAQPDRLLVVSEAPVALPQQTGAISPATFSALRRESGALGGIAVLQSTAASLRGQDEPERVRGALINVEGFGALGVVPALGRSFIAEDEREDSRVVMISHAVWQRQFGGDLTVPGRSVYINGVEHTVIGVTPEAFTFPAGTQLWQPLVLSAGAAADADQRSLQAIVRMASGQRVDGVRAHLAGVRAALQREHPEAWDGWLLQAEHAEKVFGSGPRPYMISMLVAVAFVMLIACANVATLLLARSATRQREMALRVALGAGRGALLRQCLVESILLATLGGAAGLILSLWGVALIGQAVPAELHTVISGYDTLRIDGRAVAFAMLVAVLSGVLFGLAPAVDAMRMRVREWLAQGGAGADAVPRSERLRQTLIVGQIALASALLVSAVLMLQSVIRLAGADPGFDPARALTLRVSVPQQGYEEDAAIVAFYHRLSDQLGELPEVEGVGLVSVLPMSWNSLSTPVAVEGRLPARMADAERVQYRVISRDYFQVLGLRPEQGADFSALTPAAPPVALLSASAARRLFGEGEAVGRRLRLNDGDEWVEVIGVMPDVQHNLLAAADPQIVLYVPVEQRPPRAMSVFVRTRSTDPNDAAAAVRRAVAGVDARVAAGEMFSMQRVLDTATSPQRATAGTLFVLGVIAVLLAALGIYGVISYFVARRSREIAIRRALGARTAGLLGQVLGHSLRLAATGVVIGLLGALAMARTLQAILYETNAVDPLTYAGVAVMIPIVVLLASALPALRAAAIDPGAVLRRSV